MGAWRGLVYAVGAGGTVLRRDDKGWRPLSTGMGEDHEQNAVWGTTRATGRLRIDVLRDMGRRLVGDGPGWSRPS